MRVALVEDDYLQANLIQTQAAGRIDIVHVMPSVAHAITWPGWHTVQGALIDWRLPDGDGDEVLDWLAEVHPDIVCVILTAQQAVPEHDHAVAVVTKDRLAAAVAVLAGAG